MASSCFVFSLCVVLIICLSQLTLCTAKKHVHKLKKTKPKTDEILYKTSLEDDIKSMGNSDDIMPPLTNRYGGRGMSQDDRDLLDCKLTYDRLKREYKECQAKKGELGETSEGEDIKTAEEVDKSINKPKKSPPLMLKPKKVKPKPKNKGKPKRSRGVY